MRNPSTSSLGHLDRLARVRFLTLPSSRKRTAGGKFRLGMRLRLHGYYHIEYIGLYQVNNVLSTWVHKLVHESFKGFVIKELQRHMA